MSREHANGFGAAIGPIEAMENDQEEVDGDFGHVDGRPIHVIQYGSTNYETRPSIADTHANLVRMTTARELFMKALATKQVELRPDGESGRWRFFIPSGVEADIIPWWMGKKDDEKLWLWGEAGKMACPTWDLPAGAPSIGGTCPGAVAGQSVVPRAQREAMQRGAYSPPGLKTRFTAHLDEGTTDTAGQNGGTICQYCYAMGGQYWNQGVQPKEILTYWWSQKAIVDKSFAPIVAESLLNDPRLRAHTVHGVKHRPVRLHSSGDFFSPAYAAAWVETCNLVGDAEAERGLTSSLFWAPTRTWVTWSREAWKKILSNLKRPNLVVRASAYNLDDAAPGYLTEGGAAVHGNATGSTSVWKAHQKPNDSRFDYNCPVYAEVEKRDAAESVEVDANGTPRKKAKSVTCTSVGCRACWIHPDQRINYTTHF